MALNELQTKEALRVANDWLIITAPPGAAAAQEGIANTIPLIMMGIEAPKDLDELAAIVEEYARPKDDPDLHDAIVAAFVQVKSSGVAG